MADVVVAGAGVIGVFAALALQERGAEVTLCDPWEPGHPRATSSSETRVIRAIYGHDRLYAEWSCQALELWERFEASVGRQVLHRTGVLWLAREEHGYAAAGLKVLADLGMPGERLTASELEARFPAVRAAGLRFGVLEPRMGVLRARAGVRLAVAHFVRRGGRFLRGPVVPGSATMERLTSVRVGEDRLAAHAFVFACGPWLPRLFAELRGLIRVQRAEELYFGVPQGSRDFDEDRLPAWVEIGEYYGIPALEGRAFKVGIDRPGDEIDPSTGERLLAPWAVGEARGYLARRFPALAEAPLVDSRVCTYEVTPDEHLVVDRHPRHENVVLVGGGSGHAYKLAPVLGAYVADLVTGARSETEPRFRIGRREPRAWREP
ncbi:MAG TPA: FAD-dependent oxidoreductase [Vicinamibacteria bacterium]|nr:FAD-dependent oxidoreductase [Vicinamibacteria bacterium]